MLPCRTGQTRAGSLGIAHANSNFHFAIAPVVPDSVCSGREEMNVVPTAFLAKKLAAVAATVVSWQDNFRRQFATLNAAFRPGLDSNGVGISRDN
jgi:hypothetical protein